MTSDTQIRTAAVFAVALLALSACAFPIFAGDLDAAAGDSQSNPYTVNIVKGQKWEYTPTFPSSLSPTIAIEKQGTSWTSTNGTYATVSSGKVTVTIPTSATSGTYMVIIKATTTQPTQVARQYVQFNIVDKLTVSGSASSINTYVGGTVSWTPTANLSGATYTVSPTLPSGLSINSSTGVISGTPTAAKANTTYTVTATTSSPSQKATTTVSIFVESAITISGSDTVYAAVGGAQDAASVSSNVGANWSITSYGTLSSGKVNISSAGAITVSAVSGDAGTHTITVKATSKATGQSTTKNITISIAEQLLYTSEPSAGIIVTG